MKSFSCRLSSYSFLKIFRATVCLGVAGLALCACHKHEPNPDEGMPTEDIVVGLPSLLPVNVDPVLAKEKIAWPVPYANTSWPSSSGSPSNTLGSLAFKWPLTIAWTAQAGRYGVARVSVPPVVADGRIFVLDATGSVSAMHESSGEEIWRRDFVTDQAEGYFGGVAYGGGVLYVAAALGTVSAVNAKNGHVIWSKSLGVPIHSSIQVEGGQLYILTTADNLIALDARTGDKVWNHQGIPEPLAFGVAKTVAFHGQSVIVGYASGELVSLSTLNGTVNWSTSVTAGRGVLTNDVPDLAASPVVVGDSVFAFNSLGVLSKVNAWTGAKVWSLALGGVVTPLAVGPMLFVVGNGGRVVAVRQSDGHVKWSHTFYSLRSQKKKINISFAAPLFMGGRLVLVSSDGFLYVLDPQTGEKIEAFDIRTGALARPVAANGHFFVLTKNGYLFAYH